MMPIEAGTMAMPGLPSDSAGGRAERRLRVDQGSVDDQFIDLDRPLTVIGRRQGSDIVIHDTNVSRMHAQIKREGSRLLIEDTNSSNGTIVNDERIERPRELRAGDVIRIGDAVFIFESSARGGWRCRGLDDGDRPGFADDEPRRRPGADPAGHGRCRSPNPLTPPPAIMDSSHTALSDSLGLRGARSRRLRRRRDRPRRRPPRDPGRLTANPSPRARPRCSIVRLAHRSALVCPSGSTAAALDGAAQGADRGRT